MLFKIAASACLLVSLVACATPGGSKSSSALNPRLAWHGDNREQLEKFIHGPDKGIAVFDWDNTVIKNDIGDATLFWMIAHDLIHKPASWAATSPLLTPAAVKTLNRDCPGSMPALLPTSTNAACTDTILSIYDGSLPGTKTSAWSSKFNKDTIEPAYAWAVQLTAGYQPDEIRKFAEQTIAFNLGNPVGTKQKLGTKEVAASIRIYEQIADLIQALQKNGFDVWIASASSQYVVEAFGRHVGVAANRVIGVRSVLDKKGRVTPGFQACGTYASGNREIISYRQGKRCWINQLVFGVKGPKLMMEQRGAVAFAAGDSDTDAFFLKDATQLRLVINRNKRELMCRAYAKSDGGDWLINPMFIKPKPRYTAGYSCKDYGLPDQTDSVY